MKKSSERSSSKESFSERSFIEKFDGRVEAALSKLGVKFSPQLRLGAAVSGGADSIALLSSLAALCRKNGVPLFVITVNHRIRPDGESEGDAKFVADYCKELRNGGCAVECFVYNIPYGRVDMCAAERGGGTEEAARYLRYEAFDSFIKDKDLSFLCLAHNKNDNLETILMRFFQGSSGTAAAGIKSQRDKCVRPLLEISRREIEDYLNFRKIPWRTDSTNSDNSYLRNRIRNVLVPVLDETFPGWQGAVLNGAEKTEQDSSLLDSFSAKLKWKRYGESLFMPLDELAVLPESIRRRLIFSAVNEIGCNERVPYSFIQRCSDMINRHSKEHDAAAGDAEKTGEMGKSGAAEKLGAAEKIAFGVRRTKKLEECRISSVKACIRLVKTKPPFDASLSDVMLFIEKQTEPKTHKGFFAIIKEKGRYELPFGTVSVADDGTAALCGHSANSLILKNISLPFCVRSRQPGDAVLSADKTMKDLNDIFSSWKIEEEMRDLIPIVQRLDTDDQEIVCVYASVYGFPDWIVKQENESLSGGVCASGR
ncbi:tRNA lysidine(34) synthetase TilS [Treponema parvum]|uniref:tRNA(Ile)-lysidine synthase n=1 Tax=Treponema parvum TaxID=138851 RepID=A0A975EZ45_9SPIR|nr:tRNA lysidine(34) synthetase TilS [Treponema parvum]QTQ11496.1 tRNA lysidine(34) synthetase TilS [Treponema parvum]